MSKKWLIGSFLILLAGCASTGSEDRTWTPKDEAAAVQLETLAAESVPAPAPPESLEAPGENAPDALLEVYVFNIGQADAMLVIGPAPARRTLLVDLGQPSGGSQLPSGLGTSAAHVVKRIKDLTGRDGVDYFVLSHYHSDHAGFGTDPEQGWGTGIIKVLSDFTIPFRVGELIHVQDGGAEFMDDSQQARGVFKTIQRRMGAWKRANRVGQSTTPAFGTAQVDLGPGVTVDILAFAGTTPGGSALVKARDAGVDYDTAPANENDLSIALQVTAGEFELFTAGDLTGTDDPAVNPLFVPRSFNNNGVVRRETFTNVEDHMVDEWVSTGRESDVEIYRANHHGSGFSTTPKLLAALDPELVIYSTGADHGHPTNSVVQRVRTTAEQLATTAVRNATGFSSAGGKVAGEIRIVVARDGKSYTVNGTRHTAFTNAAERSGNDE